ncbi:MAG: hypothetical protein IPP71_10760 [Bacteroidetes bacterium]|nr:hypothetical protein [Bacteroidota bacterium]
MKKIEIPNMNTMTDLTNSLVKKGYDENFQVNTEGLKSLSDDQIYQPSDVSIPNFYRFEGQNDPSDNAIVYVIETNDGKSGMLIDAYGVSASSKIGEFIKAVEDFQKK